MCTILDNCHNLPRIIIYSDNQNTVNIWHSLKAITPYNQLLILAIDCMITRNTDKCVLHVPGISNTVADTLSCFNNELALQLSPALEVTSFQPHQGMLGVTKKWSVCLPHPGNLSEMPGHLSNWTPSSPSTSAWPLIVPHTEATPPHLISTSPSAAFTVLTLNPHHAHLHFMSHSKQPI